MPLKEEKKLAPPGAVFRVYWDHAKKYPQSMIYMTLGSILIQATFLVGPLYLREFFNLLAENNPTAETLRTLVSILAVVVGIWIFEWAARRIQEWAVMYFQTYTMRDLSNTAFEYLMGHSYNFFVNSFSGSLTHKVSKFSRSFERMADAITQQFLPTILFVAGAIVVLYMRHPVLGIALLLWTLAFLWFQFWVARLRQPVRVKASEADTKVTATLADAISNQPTIALFGGRAFEQNNFKDVVNTWRLLTARLWVTDGWIWSGIGLFMIAIEGGLMYGALIYWAQGLLTVGDFVLIQAYLLTTFDRLVAINRELRGFYSALADGGEMVAILKTPHEVVDTKGAQPLRIQDAHIHFKNVDFYFNDNRSVLKAFELSIKGGQKIALVGPSGAGKSTITKLLLRLFDVRDGAIEIDGQNIAEVAQESLRNEIAFVPQEPILFHRTLMENIRYGRRDAIDEEVLEAAKKAHCHEFISNLPESYNTYVGERGIKLSGGERQRVAIARAILKNAPILLLDEATSSLDSESEALIQDALETLMRGKTVIVIAHRLSTIMKMDRIVVLEGGVIIADGTHQELIQKGGLYHKLWSIQAGGFFLDEAEEKANISSLVDDEEIDEETELAEEEEEE